MTGHVSEAVVAALFADLGYVPVWHLDKSGLTGVDLLLLGPAGVEILVVAVKGSTVRQGPPAVGPKPDEYVSVGPAQQGTD